MIGELILKSIFGNNKWIVRRKAFDGMSNICWQSGLGDKSYKKAKWEDERWGKEGEFFFEK